MTRILIAAGQALVAAVLLAAPVSAADASGSWRPAGTTATQHEGHTATLLNDGTVLVAGGGPSGDPGTAVEIYDPAANSWVAGPPMATPRTGHTAVRLDDGRVLVIGGMNAGRDAPDTPVASGELYDPATHSWSTAGSMAQARFQPTATVLPDGRVLVTGGYAGAGQVTATAELFDPLGGRWSPAAPMATPRTEHVALLLHNGKVLVAGGVATGDNPDGSLASAELYDFAGNRWDAAAKMPAGHAGPVAAVLRNGDALVAGGVDYQGGFGMAVQAVDLYQPARNAWVASTPLRVARGLAGGALLGNGYLLVGGGTGIRTGLQADSTGEIFDPATRHWSMVARLPDPRIGETITALRENQALLVGGSRQQTAERFVFTPPVLLGTPATLTGALAANRPLVLLSALLLLAVIAQLGWRRSRER